MFHFLQKKNYLKKSQQGDHKCASGGGGQRSMVKDHTFTFFLDPSLIKERNSQDDLMSEDIDTVKLDLD